MELSEEEKREFREFQKVSDLENATLFSTPEELAELYRGLGGVELSARALGYACRYKGLDYVKALVENGASFDYRKSTGMYEKYRLWDTNYRLSLLEINGALRNSLSMKRGDEMDRRIAGLLNAGNSTEALVLPLEERLEILRYLYENRERVSFEAGEVLYYAIIGRNREIAAELKGLGASLTEDIVKMLTGNTRSVKWDEYCNMIYGLDKSGLFEFFGDIIAELGEGTVLRFTDRLYCSTLKTFMEPDVFEFMMKNFDQSQMNKKRILMDFVLREKTDCLAAAEKYGWLNQARKRDELIEYASKREKTESTAWLLDFKNRTADLAAEQEKAEKKMMRELNADPNSVSELKKIWSYKKREDGTLVITSYKGSKTEITVPAKIGREAVTAIGARAFSPRAPRRTQEQANNRARIQKITLPDSVKVIEEGAFEWCKALKEINVPDGVTEICNFVFSLCDIKSLTLPDSVKSIGEYAFSRCSSMEKINLPDGISQIGKNAFSFCSSMEKINLPDGISRIGGYAFCWCNALKEIEIPDGVTELPDGLFNGCGSLQSINIPRSVTKIGSRAFFGCASLKKAVVPEGVTEIGSRAFFQCASLETLELPASVKKIENYRPRGDAPQTILYNSPNATVLVQPESYAEKYCKRCGIKFEYK